MIILGIGLHKLGCQFEIWFVPTYIEQPYFWFSKPYLLHRAHWLLETGFLGE